MNNSPIRKNLHKDYGTNPVEIPLSDKKISKHVCKKHRWKQGKFYRVCSVCGIDEEKKIAL